MKITVWGINYSPELVGIAVYNTELCEFLQARGHEVRMITAFPYYPHWKIGESYRGRWWAKELINGVKVLRTWLYVPHKPDALRRILHEATFAASSFIRAIFVRRADVLVVISPPLALGIAASVYCAVQRVPFVYHIQDLQPDAAVELGMLKPGPLVDFLYALQRLTYSRAALVTTIAPAMRETIIAEGATTEKVALLPNWTRLDYEVKAEGEWKARHDISPETKLITYSGNLGMKQGLEIILECANRLTERRDLLFVIVGNGAMLGRLKSLKEEYGLTNVRFFDTLPTEEHTQLLVDTTICVIPQKSGSSMAFLPSKLLKILSIGRPVISNADSGPLFSAITEGAFGEVTEPGNAASLADAIVCLVRDSSLRDAMCKKAKQYARQFEQDLILLEFEQRLISLGRCQNDA